MMAGVAVVAAGSGLGEAATVAVQVYGIQGDDSRGHAQGEPFGTVNPSCSDAPTCAYNGASPSLIRGDTVEFENLGKFKHTATGDLSFSPRLPEVVQPTASSNNFSTGKLESGQRLRIGPFAVDGSLDYYCLVHGPEQMRGTLTVGPPPASGTTTLTTTTTAASTTTTSPTTTTVPATTTTTGPTPAPPARHDLVVAFAPSQPPFVIGKIVRVTVVVTNAGTVDEAAYVTMSGDINYSAAQQATIPAGSSRNVVFDYPVPARLQVTLTAAGQLAAGLADASPANNQDTRTYSTTSGPVSRLFPVRVTDNSPWFLPPRLSITTGDVVEWANLSGGTHTVTSLVMAAAGQGGAVAALPGDGPLLGGDFDRRALGPGMTYRVTFSAPGLYPYLCLIHPYMSGSISVGLPGAVLPAGPLPDVVIGVGTPDTGPPSQAGAPPGVGEFCVAAQFELAPGTGVAGVVHCGDAAAFQDLPLSVFDAGCLPGATGCNPEGSLRVMGQADGEVGLVGRRIGGRWEGLNNPHDLWFDRTGRRMFVTQSHGDAFVTIDRMTNRIVDTTPVFAGADVTHVLTTPSGTVGVLSIEGGVAGLIGLFDPNHPDHPMTGYIPLTPERHPHGLWICGEGSLTAALPLSNEVAFIDLPPTALGTGQVRMVSSSVGLYPVAVGALSDCTKSYTANALSNNVIVHNPISGLPVHHVELPSCESCTLMGVPLPTMAVPNHLPPSPDGRFIVVSLAKAGRAAVIDTAGDTVVALVDCGAGCHGSAYGPKKGGGFYWWGAASHQDRLTVLDMDSLSRVGDVPLAVRSVLTLQGLTPLGCPTCPAAAPGRGGAMSVTTFPLAPPWVQPVVLR